MSEYNHYLVDDRYLPEHVAEVRRLQDELLMEKAKVRNLQAENQSLRNKLHAKPDECQKAVELQNRLDTANLSEQMYQAEKNTTKARIAELEQVKAEAAAMRQAIEAAQDESYRLEGTCIGCGAAQGHEDNCLVEQALSSEAGKALLAELEQAKEQNERLRELL